MRILRIGIPTLVTLALTACGANGILGLNPRPAGDIVVTNAVSGATLQTTFAQPFLVSGGVFSIGIAEKLFSGPYKITVTTWTAPFNIPCFVPHYVTSSTQVNVVQFTADNASPVTALTTPSPCNPFTASGFQQTDEETVEILDTDGHSVNFFYKII